MDSSGLTARLLALPPEQFELIMDLYRFYGSSTVGGILTAVAELREDKQHAQQHGVQFFHSNCSGCLAVAEALIGDSLYHD